MNASLPERRLAGAGAHSRDGSATSPRSGRASTPPRLAARARQGPARTLPARRSRGRRSNDWNPGNPRKLQPKRRLVRSPKTLLALRASSSWTPRETQEVRTTARRCRRRVEPGRNNQNSYSASSSTSSKNESESFGPGLASGWYWRVMISRSSFSKPSGVSSLTLIWVTSSVSPGSATV
ncbi:hypothetical protein HLRTI_002365 [Halorhabdus tiamatea SARL4B]|uniref:Uncharacterized protein n=1 Tax=Halorhabdus tiamatea SARL4B TaxID=1033806 RepID=U2DI61_9EURY|nr:hypothetical protein HLRTI_002365 [Halorhabdus tiamatea SARL4B]